MSSACDSGRLESQTEANTALVNFSLQRRSRPGGTWGAPRMGTLPGAAEGSRIDPARNLTDVKMPSDKDLGEDKRGCWGARLRSSSSASHRDSSEETNARLEEPNSSAY